MISKEHVPLAPFTTFHIGGPARFFITVESLEALREALAFARSRRLSVCILGGGSNVLIADDGYDGVVIHMNISGVSFEQKESTVLLTVGAGVSWDALVVATIERGLGGLECLSGIPGTVGGAVVANLGAYGAQCSDTLLSVDIIEVADDHATVRTMQKAECDFSYHDSMFGKNAGRYAIVRASFALSTVQGLQPSYRDNRFDMTTLATKLGHEPSQQEVRDAVLDMREQKGYLIMDGRTSYKSAGSFFHMPFVSKAHYEDVVARARALDFEKEERLRPWAWLQEDGTYKLAAGFLLEYTEFQKGYVRGKVGISPRHTLSIINVDTASAHEVDMLARDMQSAIAKIFGVHLEREVEYIGTV